jgi:hypothetical protein
MKYICGHLCVLTQIIYTVTHHKLVLISQVVVFSTDIVWTAPLVYPWISYYSTIFGKILPRHYVIQIMQKVCLLTVKGAPGWLTVKSIHITTSKLRVKNQLQLHGLSHWASDFTPSCSKLVAQWLWQNCVLIINSLIELIWRYITLYLIQSLFR